MPFGGFVNLVPPAVFLVIHLAAFALGLVFARRSLKAGASLLGWGFTLYAIGEVVYMTYHLDWTVFLFSHTVAEVLNLVGFALIFVASGKAAFGAVKRSA